jgi:Domain of unknown function (DUF1929)
VALVRLGAVTHSVDMEQRYVPLSFTAGSGTLTATGPANVNVAPPGRYMLFVVDANGVPSVANVVGVTAPYSYRWTNAAVGTHNLRLRASDNSGAVTTSARVSITVR